MGRGSAGWERSLGSAPVTMATQPQLRESGSHCRGKTPVEAGSAVNPLRWAIRTGVPGGAEATAKVTFRKPVSSSQGLSGGLSGLFVLGVCSPFSTKQVSWPQPSCRWQAPHLGDGGAGGGRAERSPFAASLLRLRWPQTGPPSQRDSEGKKGPVFSQEPGARKRGAGMWGRPAGAQRVVLRRGRASCTDGTAPGAVGGQPWPGGLGRPHLGHPSRRQPTPSNTLTPKGGLRDMEPLVLRPEPRSVPRGWC